MSSMFVTDPGLLRGIVNIEATTDADDESTALIVEDVPEPKQKRKRNLRNLYAKDADLTKYNQKVDDGFEGYVKKFKDLPNLPFKMGMVGMSQMSGKSNTVIGMMTRPVDERDPVEGYANSFKPEHIYLVGPTFAKDPKCLNMIEEMQIPSQNILPGFDNEELTALLNSINEAQMQRTKYDMPKEHYLVVFDDVSFDGGFKNKRYGAVAKIFCNERHNLVSVICTTQSYVDFSKTMRRNLTCLLAYPGLGESDLKLIKDDLGAGINIKEMTDIYTSCTSQPFSYLEIVRENFKPRFRDTQHQVVPNSYDMKCGYLKN